MLELAFTALETATGFGETDDDLVSRDLHILVYRTGGDHLLTIAELAGAEEQPFRQVLLVERMDIIPLSPLTATLQ